MDTNKNDNLLNHFITYRNCIFYSPLDFPEVHNNNFEKQTFSRTYLTKFIYSHSQKNLSNFQIKQNLLNDFHNENFKFYKKINHNFILTNNKYPYVSNNNNPIFIIWDLDGFSSINDIKEIIKKYFSNYDYLLWRNPYFHQSVKLIKHYHLVIREPIVKPILKKVLLVVRHGPREPIHLPKKFNASLWNMDEDNNIISKSINAKLTKLGKKYCEFRGKEAHNFYKDILDLNSINDIYVESSYIERTIESAIHYMKGFGYTFNKINVSKYLASDKLFNVIDLLKYDMYLKNFNLDIDTYKLNKKVEEVSGAQIESSMELFNIYSTIKCYKVHNYDLPSGITEIYDLIEQVVTLIYNKANEPTKNNYANIIGEKMLSHIMDLLKENKKMYYLSTHDNMMMSLLKFICYKYNVKIELLEIPDFCSCIRFEIWNEKIKIYYDSLFLLEINI